MDALQPRSIDELCSAIKRAHEDLTPLEITGRGSLSAIGAPRPHARRVDMSAFNGVHDYEPAELVLTAGAGTPLAEIEDLLSRHGQILAFEPFDYTPLLGGKPGARPTLGGVVAAGICGPRRVSAGAARDHILGFEAVSGRGEAFVAGGKVVKNVTGYDLPKLMAASWGRLAALTSITLKVAPTPRAETTLVYTHLSTTAALSLMARAMASHSSVSAAAHTRIDSGKQPLTVLRLEGFDASVSARQRELTRLLLDYGHPHPFNGPESRELWRSVRTVAALSRHPVLWRVTCAPSRMNAFLVQMDQAGASYALDWAGALAWVAFEGSPSVLRGAAETCGGHASLVRAPLELRSATPVFHPPAHALQALQHNVRRAFDPRDVFETGRFLDRADAN